MAKVGRCTEIGGKFRIILDRFKGRSRAAVSIFADQFVDRRVLSELFYSRSKHDQLGTVGKRHSSSVDGLIPEPRALRLVRIQVDNRLLDLSVKQEDVNSETQLRSFLEALFVVTNKKSFDCQSPVFVSPHDGQNIHYRQVLDEVARGIVQDAPDWIIRASHDPLHAVNSAQKMAPIDAVLSSGSDQNVLVVVRHPDHFMGHYLPNRK